jgi:hypothetical protein
LKGENEMNEEKIQEKKADEIYCPSCAKPIKKDAVVCPNCGVQIKELKATPEVQVMSEEDELKEGERQLSGIKIFYVFFSVIFFFTYIAAVVTTILNPSGDIPAVASVFGATIGFIILIALYIIPLVGIMKRKPFSVPFTRVILVLTMFYFPIGTIIGAVLWKRINHSFAKKYLNYGV